MGWYKHSWGTENIFTPHYDCDRPRLYDELENDSSYNPTLREYAEEGDEWICDVCRTRWRVIRSHISGVLIWHRRWWKARK